MLSKGTTHHIRNWVTQLRHYRGGWMNANMAIALTHAVQYRVCVCSDSDRTSVSAEQLWELTGEMGKATPDPRSA